jgi:hypothetical protein
MLQRLSCGHPMIVVVDQELADDVTGVWMLRYQLGQTCPFFLWEVEFHVARYLLELVKQLFVWSSNDIVNFVDLIEFIGSWEKWS